MKKLTFSLWIMLLLSSNMLIGQTNLVDIGSFDNVIISPYIQADFKQGDNESVLIESLEVPKEKLHIEVNGRTLRIYLEGAKKFVRSKRTNPRSLYTHTMARVTINYAYLYKIAIKGEEELVMHSHVEQEELRIKMYGDSKLTLNSVELKRIHVSLYGDNEFKVQDGNVTYQKYTSYGDSNIDTRKINNSTARLTSYGDSNFNLKVSKRIKLTAFGDTSVKYQGNAKLSKGIVLGETEISKENTL